MNYAVILAGGSGARFGTTIPKQFLPINNRPMICYSLNEFSKHHEIDRIIIVTHKDYLFETKHIVQKYDFKKVVGILPGGTNRQESSFIGLTFIDEIKSTEEKNYVLIHDACRPLLTQNMISSVLDATKISDAATLVAESTDTLIYSTDHQNIESCLNREDIYKVQTPQGFEFTSILNIHNQHLGKSFTDDSQLVINSQKKVSLILNREANLKITTSLDLKFAETILK